MLREDWVFRRGDIYLVELEPRIGFVQSGTRPVIVLQNNCGNFFAPTLIVAPLTSNIYKKRNLPTHYYLNNDDVLYPSVVMLEQIITKSVSRFARNTVDSLVAVRKLKENGVEVYFEKEGIYTFDSKGELLITIMSSLAQEESRSISENVTWGQRKRFEDGKVNLPYKQFLGYEKGSDGLPKIVEAEAEIVRRIYSMFIDGKTTGAIARTLTNEGIPTPAGKSKWQSSTVRSILTNEKYKGAALLQKRFTVDFLTKKQKVNESEVKQYSRDTEQAPHHPEAIPHFV